MKSMAAKQVLIQYLVAPVRERGLKSLSITDEALKELVAPVRERGLKYSPSIQGCSHLSVAPVRERGLKFLLCSGIYPVTRRSREGAWIEMKESAQKHWKEFKSLP